MTTDSRFTLASKLAQFLRKNGDKVINGSCKLSLTTSALCLLNSLFSDVLSNQDWPSRQNVLENAYDIHEDVQYLYHFIKRTTSLKLFHGMQTLRGGVDLSHFSNLTVLELRKIPAHLIIGLNSLSIQLKALICSRSIYLLKELFSNCVDEENSEDLWTDLKELNLSYNYLESLDNSLESLPNVEILDLSHNSIKDTRDIKVLNKLLFVNLSYNQLDNLPSFSSLSCRSIVELYVRNNNLENLDGLECLFNLEELDIGYNLLSDYVALHPLEKLKSLKKLNLEGNPIFFHKHHSNVVCVYLHPCVLSKGVRLNGKFILIPESILSAQRNTVQATNSRHQTSINAVVGDLQNATGPPEMKPHSLNISPLISVASDKGLFEENIVSSYSSQGEPTIASIEKSEAKLHKKSKKSKKPKSREVTITEPEDEEKENAQSLQALENIPSYLKTKQLIETRRQEHGESWLIPDNSFQKLAISPPNVPSNTPISCSIESPKQTDLCELIESHLESQNIQSITAISVKEMTEILDIDSEIQDGEPNRIRHGSKDSDIEILSSDPLNSQDNVTDIKSDLVSDNLSDSDVYRDDAAYFGAEIESESEEESEDSIFIVEKVEKSNKQYMSVIIGAKFIKERDVISGEIIDRLDMHCLYNACIVTVEKDDSRLHEVHLEFDTTKVSRRQRLYIFEDIEPAQKMVALLKPFVDNYTLKEATVGALECVKCNSQFSKQVANRIVIKSKKPLKGKESLPPNYDESKGYYQEVDSCPNCGNHILVELDSVPLPAIAALPSSTMPYNLSSSVPLASSPKTKNSPDTVSVGSSSSGNLFSSLFSSIKISPMLKRKSIDMSSVDTQVLDNSNISTRSENEYPKRKESTSQMSRNSSDITLISNPSQSSISIIPEPEIDSNLNTILEQASQSSLSPPVSSGSSVQKAISGNTDSEKDNPSLRTENATNYKEDPDFYSANESFDDGKQKQIKTSDSNDSDVFHSPNRSSESANKDRQLNEEDAESRKILNILGEKNNISFDFFTHLDHRLKLHIEINIFKDTEYLEACLQVPIVPLLTGDEVEGVFILSSKNVYVIHFLPQFSLNLEKGKPLEKTLQMLYSGPVHQIKQIKTILGNQGLTIACGPPTAVYTLLTRDADICNSFCALISEKIQEKNPKLKCLTSTKEVLQLIADSVFSLSENEDKEKVPEVLLHVFAFKCNLFEKNLLSPVCLILTEEDLYLTKILYKRQQSCPDIENTQIYCYSDIEHLKISDVILVEVHSDYKTVCIKFLHESPDPYDAVEWTLQMLTKSALNSFISALKGPWEDLFDVSLPLSLKEA